MKRTKIPTLLILLLVLANHRAFGFLTVTHSTDTVYFGNVMASGDFNGDGHIDFAFASKSDTNSQGAVYIMWGSSSFSSTYTTSFTASSSSFSQGIVIRGDSAGNTNFGESIAMADVDGDGTVDLIVGAPQVTSTAGTYSGAIYVIFGSSSITTGFTIDSPPSSAVVAKILGTANYNYFGYNIVAVDVNGDSCADILVYASNDGNNGAVYLIYGGDSNNGNNLRTSVPTPSQSGFSGGIRIDGPSSASPSFGQTLGSTADIDGDGKNDIIIGLPSENLSKGGVYVISSTILQTGGGTITCSKTATVSGVYRFADSSATSYGYFGQSVASIGDLDNDGKPELVIGAPGETSGKGAVYLVYSSVFSSSQSATGYSVATTSGITRIGGDSSIYGAFGQSLAAAGNFDSTGKDGFFVGAKDESSSQGAVYYISGSRTLTSAFSVSSTSSVTGVTRIPGSTSSTNFGKTLHFTSATTPMMMGGYGYVSFLSCVTGEIHPDIYTCFACTGIDSSCSTCSSTTTCTACSGGKVPASGGGSCMTCSQIDSSCTTCSDYQSCSACSGGLVPSSTHATCMQCSGIDALCTACSDYQTCTACSGAYAPASNHGSCVACSSIHASCTACSNYQTCTSCSGGLVPSASGSTCVACSTIDSSCTSCSNSHTCTTCSGGLVPSASGSSCVSCSNIHASCTACSDYQTCTQCDSTTSYILSGGTCVLPKPAKQGLSGGAIAGIVVGCAAFMGLVFGAILYVVKFKGVALMKAAKAAKYAANGANTEAPGVHQPLPTSPNTVTTEAADPLNA